MKNKLFTKIITGVLAVSAIYAANRFLFNNFLQNSTVSIYGNVGSFITRKFSGLPGYFRAYFGRYKIADENEQLKKTNIELENQLADLKAIERENETLKKQLDIQHTEKISLLEAKIISVERSGLTSTFMIGEGSNNGIDKSMAVISGGNVLAGLVSEVFDDHSRVILLDDPRSQISVRIGDIGVIGTARGTSSRNGNIILDLVTNKDEITAGDLISTSGLDGLPEALLVGKISKVGIKGGSLFKEVEAELIFNLSLGPNIFIIKNK